MKEGDKISLPCGSSAEIIRLCREPSTPENGLAIIALRDMVHTRMYHEVGHLNPTVELRFLAKSIPETIRALQAIEKALCPRKS